MTHHSSFHGPRIGGILLLGLIGVAVLATGGVAAQQDVAASDLMGEGSQDAPYAISTAAELQAIEDDLDAHYFLAANINATQTAQWNSGDGFDPIGNNSSPFTGSFSGNNYTVTGLTINRSDDEQVGLIGHADSNAVIGNITLKNITVTGSSEVGSLIGVNSGGSIMTTKVTGTVTGSSEVGGLAGVNEGGYIGNATVAATVSGSDNVGGLVGKNEGSIKMATATGAVTGSENVGGLVGDSSTGTVQDSYWDTEATGQSSSAGGTGLTTAEMTGSAAKANMNLAFGSVWETQPAGYPALTPLTRKEYIVYFTDEKSLNGSMDNKEYFDTLESNANISQQKFKNYVNRTSNIAIKNELVLVNALVVKIDTDQVSLEKIKSRHNVTHIGGNEPVKISLPGSNVSGDPPTQGPPNIEDVRRTLSFFSPTMTSTPKVKDAVSDTGGITVVPANTETVNSITFARDHLSGSLQITEYSDPVPQIRDQVTASIVAAGAVNSSNKSTESDPAVDVVSVANISLPADPRKENPATVTLSAPQNVVENPQDLTIIKTTYDFDAQELTWSQLETSVKRTSGDTITVSGQVERFSLFVLCEVDQQRSSQTATDTSGDQPSETADHSGSGGVVGGGILPVVVVAAAVVYQRRK